MWTYKQSTGEILHDGELRSTGYSGSPEGKNDGSKEAIHNVGPIPRGRWKIDGAFSSAQFAFPTMHVYPMAGTETHGRDGFLIHGDSSLHAGAASHGCIVLPKLARMAIASSADKELEVIA